MDIYIESFMLYIYIYLHTDTLTAKKKRERNERFHRLDIYCLIEFQSPSSYYCYSFLFSSFQPSIEKYNKHILARSKFAERKKKKKKNDK